jgi:hypothetical protein
MLFIVFLKYCAGFFLSTRNGNERRRSDSNNSLLFPLFKCWKEKNVLPYGKYIEYKSCQINKINVVPITIIFDETARERKKERELLWFKQKKSVLPQNMRSNWTSELESIYEYKVIFISSSMIRDLFFFYHGLLRHDLGLLQNWLWFCWKKGQYHCMCWISSFVVFCRDFNLLFWAIYCPMYESFVVR